MASCRSIAGSKKDREPFLGKQRKSSSTSPGARYRDQQLAAAWLPYEAVAKCGLHVRQDLQTPGFGPRIGWTLGERASWLDLHCCGSVWHCPVCAWRICEQRRRELQAGVDRWQGRGGAVLQVVFTIPHVFRDRLPELNALFMDAMGRMTGYRAYVALLKRWGRVHHVYAQEVTWSDFNGWHEHRHDLWFTEPGSLAACCPAVDYELLARALERAITPHWEKACRAAGVRIRKPGDFRDRAVHVTVGYAGVADYIAKWGHEPEKRWSLADEVTKGQKKRAYSEHYTPFGMLAAARETPQDAAKLQKAFCEYAEVYKGKRQLVWSAGAKEDLGIGQVDDQAAAELEDPFAEELRTYAAEWAAIVAAEAKGRVVAAAVEFGRDGVLREIRRAVGLLDPKLRAAVVELQGGRFVFPSPVYDALTTPATLLHGHATPEPEGGAYLDRIVALAGGP